MSTATVRECLFIIEEPTYGVAAVTPVVWPTTSPTAYYIPLTEGNSFTMVEDPVLVETMYGGGVATPDEVEGDHRECKGNLKVLAYPALAAFLANLAVTPSNGSTVPYVNAEPAGDRASVTMIHGFKGRDGTTWIYGYSGVKVTTGGLDVSTADPRVMLTFGLQGQKETPNALDSSAAPSLTWPTEAQLPKGPYLLSHSAGTMKLGSSTGTGGTALAQYESISLKVTNKPDPRFFENHWLYCLGVYGVEATADVLLLLKATPALRTAYQAITSQGFSVEFNNGTNTLTVNFNGNNHINKLPFNLDIGKEFLQPTTFRNKYDRTAGAALTIASS
jgi:Phage tail tube protein